MFVKERLTEDEYKRRYLYYSRKADIELGMLYIVIICLIALIITH